MSAYAALQDGDKFFDDDDEIVIKYNDSSEDEDIVLNKPSSIPLPSRDLEFTLTEDNVITNPDHIIVGLKVGESLKIIGQFKIQIQRGAVKFNSAHYYHAPQEFTIVQHNLSSAIVISSTQVVSREGIKDLCTQDNEHLFTSDYKSVVKISNLKTGLENISKYPPFKNAFTLDDNNEVLDLSEYSFDILALCRDGLKYDGYIVEEVDKIIQGLETPSSFITVGNKNSGKSTISKLLINKLVSNSPVTVLDLDPGQSEYSKPYCISITNHFEPLFGFNYNTHAYDRHYYYGFTNPQSNPEIYKSIIQSLVNYYNKFLKQRGHHLVINSAGWVKGYGKQLLIELTQMLCPDYLFVLTPNGEFNEDMTSKLIFNNTRTWKGLYIQSKYSAAGIRNFSKLAFFHRQDKLKYNLEQHLLEMSPLKVSYQSDVEEILGVNVVSILNYDEGLNFDIEDLNLMIDSSIVGLYLIDSEYYTINKPSIVFTKGQMPYLNASNYNEFMEYESDHIRFFTVGIVHSINTLEKYINLYLPPSDNLDELKDLMTKGYKLMLIKGESDIPSSEILMPELLQLYKRKYKKNFKKKDMIPKYPYVSYHHGINGVWRIRRNVMRRNQQNM